MNTSVFATGYEQYRIDVLNNMKTLGIFGDEVEQPTEINPHGEGELGDPNYNPKDNNIIGVPEGAEWPHNWV